jgi:hypothetical protein
MLLNLKNLNTELGKYLVAKKIQLFEAYEISRLSTDEQEAILRLVTGAHFSFSKFKEVLMNLLELSLKKKTNIDSVINDQSIGSILEDRNSDRNLKGERIRKAIFVMRYPKFEI